MSFNVDKCHVMHMGRRNLQHEYKMEDKVLKETRLERDVGVMIDESMKPGEHCKKAARTAGAVLNQILKAFHYRDRKTFVGLYKQYVRL